LTFRNVGYNETELTGARALHSVDVVNTDLGQPSNPVTHPVQQLSLI